MCRFEFLEILVRMGRYKFLEPGKVATYAEAFRQIIKLVLPWHNRIYPGQIFRDHQLWTLESNDILEANIDSLSKLYKLAKGKKKLLSY